MPLTSLFSFLMTLAMLPFLSDQSELDARLIDRIVRDSAFRSFPKHPRTSHLYTVHLPANLTGITADVARFRAGSLRRHGAAMQEFRFPPGVVVHPHMKRLVVVHQNLGNYSSLCSSYQNFSGHRLVSPVLGLLIYDAANLNADHQTRYPFELEVTVKKRPIMINFSQVVDDTNVDVGELKCATFELDGEVRLSNQSDGNVCLAWRQGHFAMVVESVARRGDGKLVKPMFISKWKVVVMSAIGGGFGAVLLGLLVVAMVSVKRKKGRMAELERRAYEEEALRISMVGHVRAPTAPVARTRPALENDYNPVLRIFFLPN